MKKFIIDKSSIDNFIRTVESQSRFTFTRKINRDLMAAITEIIENCLENHQQTFRAKLGGKIEYLIILSTKEKLKTIDLTVNNSLTNQTICQESYTMPTKTLLPYTFNEIIRSISSLTALFTNEQLEALIQTSVNKHSAMSTASAGVNIITDFQNDVLTCTMFNDEEIVNTLHFFVPKESIELGFNPTLYRYLSLDFDQYEGVPDKQRSLRCPATIDGLIQIVSGWGEVDEALVSKLLHKLLYSPEYASGNMSASVISGTVPGVIFTLGERRYTTHLNKTLISEIVNRSGEKYKTALRNSLLESSRKKEESSQSAESAPAQERNTQPTGRPSLITKTSEKKLEPATPKLVGLPTNVSTKGLYEAQQTLHEKKLTDYQLEALFKTLKEIDNPEQAYDEIVKFIGDEVEFRGKITHKDMLVMYHFGREHDKKDEGESSLKIDIKINRLNPQHPSQIKRLFCFTVDARRKDVELISVAFNYLRNMFN